MYHIPFPCGAFTTSFNIILALCISCSVFITQCALIYDLFYDAPHWQYVCIYVNMIVLSSFSH